MKVSTVNAEFTCDACHSETASSSGALPAGWIARTMSKVVALSGIIKKSIHLGPMCKNSNDPAVIKAIRDLLIND